MHNRSFWGPLLAFLLALAGAAVVGVVAFDAGVAHGVTEAARTVAVPVETGSRVYVWPGPWAGHGYGFGFFPVFPFVAIFLLIAFARRLFWRRRWYAGHLPHGRHFGPGGPGGASGCGRGGDGVPPMFEEWHRRAHERQGTPPPPTSERTA